MLGQNVEETEQTFHTLHKFCHKICYPHPPGHNMNRKIVFALSHIHSDISGKTKPCHSTIKMAEGTGRCVTGQKAKWNLSDDNRSDYEGVHLHTLILSTGNLHTLSQQIMIATAFWVNKT